MPRPRKPVRLARLPNRESWYIRDGRKVLSTGTADEEEAKCFLADYIRAKETPKAPTIGWLLDERLKDLEAARKARAANTPYIHKALKENFGHLRPDQLSPSILNIYAAKRTATPAALREELLELKTALARAVRLGLIEKAPHIEVPRRSPPREQYLSRSQAGALLNAARPFHLRLYILIAKATGARNGAILGLTWERVDLKRGRIDFTDPTRAETKKRRTVVPIGPQTVSALKMAKRMAETAYVIEYAGKPVTSVKKSFAKAAKEAGVPWATPHILKHSVISWLAEDGVTVDRISDLTATHPNTVRRIYRKFSPDYLEEIALLLDSEEGFANQFAKPKATKRKRLAESAAK